MEKTKLTETLEQIITDLGREILDEPVRIQKVFLDYCPDRREAEKLKITCETKVFQQLVSASKSQQDSTVLCNKVIHTLMDERFMSEEMAQQLVYGIADALKLQYSSRALEEERKRQEAEAARKAEEARKRQEAEAARKAEEARKRQEAEAARKAEEARKRKQAAAAAAKTASASQQQQALGKKQAELQKLKAKMDGELLQKTNEGWQAAVKIYNEQMIPCVGNETALQPMLLDYRDQLCQAIYGEAYSLSLEKKTRPLAGYLYHCLPDDYLDSSTRYQRLVGSAGKTNTALNWVILLLYMAAHICAICLWHDIEDSFWIRCLVFAVPTVLFAVIGNIKDKELPCMDDNHTNLWMLFIIIPLLIIDMFLYRDMGFWSRLWTTLGFNAMNLVLILIFFAFGTNSYKEIEKIK